VEAFWTITSVLPRINFSTAHQLFDARRVPLSQFGAITVVRAV
jgi:hypothetical protein